MIRARFLAAALLLTALPAFALAEPESCRPDAFATPDLTQADAARLRCDLDRAAGISERSERLHGPAPEASIKIVDTFSPSGAAYVYFVHKEHGWNFLEARSVPGANSSSAAPACRLGTTLPGDVVEAMNGLLARLEQNPGPAYGPREEITVNPDGSRSVRIIFDSHDVVTRIDLPGGPKHFSRHARSGDDVTRLNELVIGVANVSSAWSCDAS